MDESHNLRSLPPLATRAGAVQPFRAMRIGAQADMMIAAGVDVIKLNLGQPDYDAPEPVRTAMRDLYDGRALPYTEAKGLPELRRKISEFYATQHQVNVDPGRIVITAGGSTALLLANVFRLGFLSVCIAEVSAWPGAAVLLCATYYCRAAKAAQGAVLKR